jgi:membrane fusion protein, multidrug efflux system
MPHWMLPRRSLQPCRVKKLRLFSMPGLFLSAAALLTLFVANCGLAIAEDAIPVEIKPLSTIAIFPQLRAPATVISNNDSRISAEISARIMDLPVKVGDTVKKGDVIARLESSFYQQALDGEEAALEALAAKIDLAKYDLKHAQALSQKQALSEQLLKQRETDLATLQANYKGQQARVEQAKNQLSKTVIRALFPGVITQRPGHIGELATPGSPLLQLVDTSGLEVSAKIQARYAAGLQQEKNLTLLCDGKNYPLTLRVITPAIDSLSRTREARLLFKGKSAMPGSSGELIWRRSEASLPAELIVRRKGKLGVFILRDKRAHFVVLPDAEEGQPAITTLASDTPVITLGRFRLQDGDPVEVQSESR